MILYFDCFSGISGNMAIGSFLDMGIDFAWFKAELEKLNLPDDFELVMEKTEKCGITGTYFNVKIQGQNDHAHHHVHEQHHCHEHHHSDDHHHSDKHTHCHNHDDHEHHCHSHHHEHTHSHEHRNLHDIHQIIDNSTLSESIKIKSKQIFEFVANAESKIHNKNFDELHFHEVGAIDSIIDIVGTAICLEKLSPEKIYASNIAIGSGFIECAHGTMPIPAPATTEIIKEAKIPVYAGNEKAELTTPTGAAILASIVDEYCDLPNAKIESIGYGAGSKNFATPNLLRVYSIETTTCKKKV